MTNCVWHLVVWKSTLVENTSQVYPGGCSSSSLEGWGQGTFISISFPGNSPRRWRSPKPSASWTSLDMGDEMRESPSLFPAQTFHFFHFVYEKNGITFLPHWWCHGGHLCCVRLRLKHLLKLIPVLFFCSVCQLSHNSSVRYRFSFVMEDAGQLKRQIMREAQSFRCDHREP